MNTNTNIYRLVRSLLLLLSFGSAGMSFAQNIADCPSGSFNYSANFAAISIQTEGQQGGDYGNLLDYNGTLPGDPGDLAYTGFTSPYTNIGSGPFYYVGVDDSEDPSAYTALPTAPSTSHSISFVVNPTEFAVQNNFTFDINNLNVVANGEYEVYFDGVLVTPGFTATGLTLDDSTSYNSMHQIEIRPFSTSGEDTFVITDIDFDVTMYGPDGIYDACDGHQIVPEPSAALLGLLGGAGLAFRRRR